MAMCPEFLREGTGVADFFDPPFTVIGTDEERCAKVLLELFSFIDRPARVVPIRAAELLKYACNAFHATKVSFANEIGRIGRTVGVDARVVMELFCADDHLNISPLYLRPGFAFGGSCLPKDLDGLLHVARRHCVDAPMLTGVRSTNDVSMRTAVQEILATGRTRVTLLGLSFKPDTDDLRSSPFVELAERLVGKGMDLAIYDPIVRPERLVGGNLRYVQQRLPHLHRLLVDDVGRSLVRSDIAVVGMVNAEIKRALAVHAPAHVFDLVGSLGEEIEALPGYHGVSW
jgi:GDP-mannose 6-dehydrogenase